MNKVLFEKIVGPAFSHTNYKVESIEDLKAVIKKQEEILNRRVFNEDSLHYALKKSEESPDNKGILDLTLSIALGDLYDHGISQVDSYEKYIQDKLAFKITREDKVEFFKEEFLRLENSFLHNPYSTLLSPKNYYNEINSYDFITNLWFHLKKNNLQAFLKWKKRHSTNIDSIFLADQENKECIHSLFVSLAEYSSLKFIYDDFKGENVQSKSGSLQFNPYPLLFQSAEAFRLFNYIISQFPEKKNSRAFLSRYYLLFREENLIEKGSLWKNYFIFLKEEHGITLGKIDERTHPNTNDRKDLEKFKINFKTSRT